jgi:hypothetical protein
MVSNPENKNYGKGLILMLRPNIIKVQPNINFTVNVYFEDGKVEIIP